MEERRHFVRFQGKGFIVQLGDKLYNVTNLSIGGIKLEGATLPLNSTHSVKLIPRNDKNLELNNSRMIDIKVVRLDKDGVGCSFTKPSFDLMKIIISHASEQTGHKPYIFK